MRNAIDFKYYDNTSEIHSAQRDPRSLESLEDVINPGFDEDGRMLTHPLPPQFPRFTQPDRQLSESAYVKSSKIMYPHLHTSNVPKHLRVATIMAKAKCPAEEAMIIANECISLNATEAMVDKFCDWAKKKGSDKLIDYLLPFTEAVVDVETSFQEIEPWEENPVEAGNPLWKNSIDKVRGYNGICEDVPVEMMGAPEKSTDSIATIIDGELTWPNEDDPTDDEENWEAQMAEWEPEDTSSDDRNPNDGGLIRYHVLEDIGVKQSKINDLIGLYSWNFIQSLSDKPLDFIEDLWNKWLSWEVKQPKWFKDAVKKIKTFTDLQKLGEWSQVVHKASGIDNHKFNNGQAGHFWTMYDSRKAELAPKHLSLTARSLLKKIIQSNGHIGALGVFLHNVQSGKIKVTPYPSKYEFGVIWKTYKRQKEVHAAE